jgi:hypothetical protein
LTTDRLLAADHDSARDLYAARVGGGFPEVEQSSSCVSSDECRTPPVAAPSPSSAASPTFQGPGNVKSVFKCPKGKVRKQGRCVKKAKKKARRHHAGKSRAGANGRAKR